MLTMREIRRYVTNQNISRPAALMHVSAIANPYEGAARAIIPTITSIADTTIPRSNFSFIVQLFVIDSRLRHIEKNILPKLLFSPIYQF